VPEFVEVARDGLDALSAAHSLGLLHLDLKSTNIMLTRLASGRRQVKLLDFGLAAMAGDSLPVAKAGDVVMGSVYTVAPEQLDRRPPDVRTDLYAFGCVLYFALARREPFQGVSVDGVLDAHRRHVFRPLIERRPDLPLSLCSWVERLMARQPEDRPASARAALADLFALAGLWENLNPPVPGVLPFVPEVSVQDANALRGAVGRVITVAGAVERVWENGVGTIRLLSFRDTPHESFAVVVPLGEDTDPALLERLAELVGVDIRVTGRVTTFHGSPEIVVRSPGQIQAPGPGWG
jgi:serine/threonine protein kinase